MSEGFHVHGPHDHEWNFYQAKSNKQNLAELGATLTTGRVSDDYRTEVERYRKETDKITADAKALEQVSRDADAKSDVSMHLHHQWAQSLALIQIAAAREANSAGDGRFEG